MSLLIIGSIALDTIETPFGKVEMELGGSATFSSLAAALHTHPSIIGVIGDDFPQQHLQMLQEKGVNTTGVVQQPGKTFHWEGAYDYNLNSAQTKKTELGVFADFHPDTFDRFQEFSFVFLGNIHPALQLAVLEKTAASAPFTAVDTMNFWIESEKDLLTEVISRVDLVFMNEGEARQYTGHYNLLQAARSILSRGPKYLMIKQGEYGAVLFSNDQLFSIPGFLLETVKDPTGAGDSFAGGVMGYLSNYFQTLENYDAKPKFRDVFTFDTMKTAMVQGNILASFTVEEFGTGRLVTVSTKELDERYGVFQSLVSF
ncbi:MAG: PfkB family carbohydrate kinase [bacterium]